MNRPGFAGGWEVELRYQRKRLLVGIVARLGLGGWDVADCLEETPVVEPVHPFEGGELDGLERLPGPAPPDHLGLEQADDALCQCVIVGITDAADGWLDAGACQALGVANAEVLTPAEWMMSPLVGRCRCAAMSRAAETSSVRRCSRIAQPTTLRVARSSTAAR